MRLGTARSDLLASWTDPNNPDFRRIEESQRRIAAERRTATGRPITYVDRLALRIGKRYADCTLENYRVDSEGQRAAVEKVRRYLEGLNTALEAGANLVFYGPCGTGKDHLMAAAMMRAAKRGVDVHWVNGLNWFGRVRADLDHTEQMIDLLVRPTILAISDPIPPAITNGKADGELTAWRIELLQRVVDARYRDMKPIWMTINVTGAEGLKARLSTPIAERLMDNVTGIQCSWGSFRVNNVFDD